MPDYGRGRPLTLGERKSLARTYQRSIIIALCKDRLGSVMAPKSVDFVDRLPRSPVGKVRFTRAAGSAGAAGPRIGAR